MNENEVTSVYCPVSQAGFFPSALFKLKDIDWDDVIYCEAAGCAAIIYFINGIKVKYAVNSAYVEKIMPYGSFIRCHRKFIVNFNYVKKINLKNPSAICLMNDLLIPVSARKKTTLKRMYGRFLIKNISFYQK